MFWLDLDEGRSYLVRDSKVESGSKNKRKEKVLGKGKRLTIPPSITAAWYVLLVSISLNLETIAIVVSPEIPWLSIYTQHEFLLNI